MIVITVMLVHTNDGYHAAGGLLRPFSSAPTWLSPGAYARRDKRNWDFQPIVADGEMVSAGAVLGVIRDANPVEYRVLVPPGVEGQVGLEFVNQGPFHRYSAVLVALAVHVNDAALICQSDVADVCAHELVRA